MENLDLMDLIFADGWTSCQTAWPHQSTKGLDALRGDDKDKDKDKKTTKTKTKAKTTTQVSPL